jgi:hypothetical protein
VRLSLSIAVTVLALALVGGTAAQPLVAKPAVRALRGSATAVQGTGFKPGEHLVVTLFVAAQVRETKRRVATKAGSFVARFAYEIPACTPWLVRVVGPKSGRLWYRSLARECSPT